MPEPTPIRGRWTLWPTFVMPGGVVGEVERCCAIDGPNVPPGQKVEVVPVPDEQAIERAAHAMWEANHRVVPLARYRSLFVLGLAAALEQPE